MPTGQDLVSTRRTVVSILVMATVTAAGCVTARRGSAEQGTVDVVLDELTARLEATLAHLETGRDTQLVRAGDRTYQDGDPWPFRLLVLQYPAMLGLGVGLWYFIWRYGYRPHTRRQKSDFRSHPPGSASLTTNPP